MKKFLALMILVSLSLAKEIPKDVQNYYGDSSRNMKCDMYIQKQFNAETDEDFVYYMIKADEFCNV